MKACTAFRCLLQNERVGAIGVRPNPPLTDTECAGLAAAAALLGPAVKNAELYSEVQKNSVRDVLTGCFNRRHALHVLDSELRRTRRSHGAFSLVMLDLDHFKTINDRFVHLWGDAVLAHVGQRMKAVLRGSDTKCRYGGEEFLVLLPDTPLLGARRVAELLRKDLEQHPVTWNDQTLTVRANFGIAEMNAAEDSTNAIIARADAALYHAKQDGRNCVRTPDRQGLNIKWPRTRARRSRNAPREPLSEQPTLAADTLYERPCRSSTRTAALTSRGLSYAYCGEPRTLEFESRSRRFLQRS